ncbi:hypothetical protein [Massilia aurea]|uniref:hypothetical protein n=1 Tax=Massilia aurea TaxID=373040 RepID=UPI0011CDD6AB|nr:hypothetical protein [Massilia aurea]
MGKKSPKLPAQRIHANAHNSPPKAGVVVGGAPLSLRLSQVEQKMMSLANTANGISADQDNPFIALKYFRSSYECFSQWEKDELKAFSDFLTSMHQRTWQQVLTSSGKGPNKAGFAYTPYDESGARDGARSHLKAVRQQIGEDITFFELRLNSKMRVHGFRAKAIFFLVLLDREHRVFG